MIHSDTECNDHFIPRLFSNLNILVIIWFLDYSVISFNLLAFCSVPLQSKLFHVVEMSMQHIFFILHVLLFFPPSMFICMLEQIFGTNHHNICKHLYINEWVRHVFAELKSTFVCWGLSRKDDSLDVLLDCRFPNSWGTWLSVQCHLLSVLCFQLPSESSQRHGSDTQCGQSGLCKPFSIWGFEPARSIMSTQSRTVLNTEAVHLGNTVLDRVWCLLCR